MSASVLEIDRLTVALTASGRAVLSEVCLNIEPGQCVAIVGRAGSGKSFLAQIAAGHVTRVHAMVSGGLTVEAGSVRFAGEDLLRNRREWPAAVLDGRIALVPQRIWTALDSGARMGTELSHVEESLMEGLGLSSVGPLAQHPLHQLSSGLRQRLLTALALAEGPELLVADEPSWALDPCAEARIFSVIDEQRRTRKMAVLLVTGNLGLVAQHADRVLVLDEGRVAELAETPQWFQQPQSKIGRELIGALG